MHKIGPVYLVIAPKFSEFSKKGLLFYAKQTMIDS